MNLNYQELVPADFSPNSRVWIYQSSRLLTISEALQVEDILKTFTSNWKSHGTPVKGYANLFFGQFIVLMADDTEDPIGGCSTDSSVRLIKDIEQLFQIQMFDRQALAFLIKERVQVVPMAQLEYALQHQFIDSNTLYFNNTVQNKEQFLNNWIIPVKESWLGRRLKLAI